MKPLLLAACLALPLTAAAATSTPPKFQEVLDLVRTNLGGLTPTEFERAALDAFLSQLDGRVLLDAKTSPVAATPTGPAVSKSAVFDGIFGYVRLSHVGPKLEDALAAEFTKLGGAEKLRGLILDLRYAGGVDQKAAARAADCFIATDRVLLTVEGEVLRATTKTNAIQLPTAILVNRHTSGAAEVLAALLRQNQVGLLIGTSTPGGMRQFKEFTLSTGQQLRIAIGETKLGDGQSLPASGLRPDIAVTVGAEEERVFYAEPYRNLGRSAVIAGGAAHGQDSPARLNEAELIRRMKEGQNPETAPVITTPSVATPQVRDPALARALDLLKGLSAVRAAKP